MVSFYRCRSPHRLALAQILWDAEVRRMNDTDDDARISANLRESSRRLVG